MRPEELFLILLPVNVVVFRVGEDLPVQKLEVPPITRITVNFTGIFTLNFYYLGTSCFFKVFTKIFL